MNLAVFQVRCAHWGGALAKAVVQGTALSVKAFFSAAGANIATAGAIPSMDWKTALAVAGFAALYNAVDFLAKNPVPDADDDPPGITSPLT